jgi:hypothetical protein
MANSFINAEAWIQSAREALDLDLLAQKNAWVPNWIPLYS